MEFAICNKFALITQDCHFFYSVSYIILFAFICFVLIVTGYMHFLVVYPTAGIAYSLVVSLWYLLLLIFPNCDLHRWKAASIQHPIEKILLTAFILGLIFPVVGGSAVIVDIPHSIYFFLA